MAIKEGFMIENDGTCKSFQALEVQLLCYRTTGHRKV